ncbi:MAG: alpha/beta hydrolase [Clostridia bacterium]|nr:alpha/beta hydrolase [Clostridia bacterium]
MNILINGLNINYEIKGEGYNVVLLHGWGASIESFRPVIDALSRDYRVICPDLPGFGKSDEPKNPFSTEDYAEFVIEFLKALQIENPVLVGHSHGGRISLCLMGKYLFPVKKAILIDSAGIKPRRTLKYYFRTYKYKLGKKILSCPLYFKYTKPIYDKYISNAGSEDYRNSSPLMKRTMSIVVNQDFSSYMKNIKTPTLLIWGDKDTATPLKDGQKMEKLIPDSGLVIFNGAGHFSYLDCFGRFISVLYEFLKKERN